LLPVGAGLAKKCIRFVEKHRTDHHPAKSLDDLVGCELEKRHKTWQSPGDLAQASLVESPGISRNTETRPTNQLLVVNLPYRQPLVAVRRQYTSLRLENDEPSVCVPEFTTVVSASTSKTAIGLESESNCPARK
jgi:hypothetical protein